MSSSESVRPSNSRSSQSSFYAGEPGGERAPDRLLVLDGRRCGVDEDQVCQPILVAHGVLLGDDAAVGLAEQREAVDPDLPRQLVEVGDPLLVGVRRLVLGAAAASRVVEEQPVLVLERAEVADVVAAIADSRPAVQDDERRRLLVSVQLEVEARGVDGCFHVSRPPRRPRPSRRRPSVARETPACCGPCRCSRAPRPPSARSAPG